MSDLFWFKYYFSKVKNVWPDIIVHVYSILRRNIVIIFCQKDILRISWSWIEHVWLVRCNFLHIKRKIEKIQSERGPASQFGNFNSNRHFLVPLFRNLVMWNLLLAIIGPGPVFWRPCGLGTGDIGARGVGGGLGPGSGQNDIIVIREIPDK